MKSASIKLSLARVRRCSAEGPSAKGLALEKNPILQRLKASQSFSKRAVTSVERPNAVSGGASGCSGSLGAYSDGLPGPPCRRYQCCWASRRMEVLAHEQARMALCIGSVWNKFQSWGWYV